MVTKLNTEDNFALGLLCLDHCSRHALHNGTLFSFLGNSTSSSSKPPGGAKGLLDLLGLSGGDQVTLLVLKNRLHGLSKLPGSLLQIIGILTNEKTVFRILTNQKTVFRILTNERPVFTFMTSCPSLGTCSMPESELHTETTSPGPHFTLRWNL